MAATKANSIVMTEGRPLPQIIRFSVPLALTGILQLLFNAADVIVVGRHPMIILILCCTIINFALTPMTRFIAKCGNVDKQLIDGSPFHDKIFLS